MAERRSVKGQAVNKMALDKPNKTKDLISETGYTKPKINHSASTQSFPPAPDRQSPVPSCLGDVEQPSFTPTPSSSRSASSQGNSQSIATNSIPQQPRVVIPESKCLPIPQSTGASMKPNATNRTGPSQIARPSQTTNKTSSSVTHPSPSGSVKASESTQSPLKGPFGGVLMESPVDVDSAACSGATQAPWKRTHRPRRPTAAPGGLPVKILATYSAA